MSSPRSPERGFWRSSGWALLTRNARGWHEVSDDFLRAYLLRPELRIVEESCAGERALHASLVDQPRRPITPVSLVGIKDADARENWSVFAGFRDRLIAAGTLEAAYLDLILDPNPRLPPLLLDQLVHAVLRGVLDGCDDPFRLRAAECLFRSQRVMQSDGAVLLADEEIVEMHESGGGSLLALAARAKGVELDVLSEANAAGYAERSDRFDMVLDVSFTRPGLDALCRVLEAWLAHLLGVAASIQPLQSARDERWAWHTGLDAEASAILNALYEGAEVPEDQLGRLLALFRLDFRDPIVVRPALRGRPVYLGMARDARGRLRLKPQNLIVNLPLAEAA
jgi:hypothetical protein